MITKSLKVTFYEVDNGGMIPSQQFFCLVPTQAGALKPNKPPTEYPGDTPFPLVKLSDHAADR